MGEALPLFTGLPFLGVLLGMALGPLLLPKLWHRFENVLLLFWSLLSVGGLLFFLPSQKVESALLHVVFFDYIPFIGILSAIFVINGGINLKLKMTVSAFSNTLYLAIASLSASVLGTTGASLLFLRPFLTLNRHRKTQSYQVVFFIFIVANVGGCLTPLGDPPLFMGFLNGIDFFWSLKTLWKPFFFMWGALLALFFGFEKFYLRRENLVGKVPFSCSLDGKINLVFLIGMVIAVILPPMIAWDHMLFVSDFGVSLKSLIRDSVFLALSGLSLFFTPSRIRQEHHFSWKPFFEVLRIFAAIFITMVPVAAMLKAGKSGAFSDIISLTERFSPEVFYFWATGFFSAFLDNAPTYLIFFHMAGGDAVHLMGPGVKILTAISLGSVFMGAMTYIGNTPNLVIQSITKQYDVKIPSFLGYMGWACAILLPLLMIMSFLSF